MEQIRSIPNVVILICFARVEDIKQVVQFCTENKIAFTHIDFYCSGKVSTRVLKALGGDIVDDRGNHIEVSMDCSDKIDILLGASSFGTVRIGAVHVINHLTIDLWGSKGSIEIGDGTSVVQANMLVNTSGKITVGKDCMLSRGVEIYQSDQHFIFDVYTHKRINYCKNIEIGNHVWIGRQCELLGGTKIGNNSIVGARAVTSGQFPENVVIVGCPAKIIRTGVIWSRDEIRDGEVDILEECKDQAALKYLPYSLKQEE